MHTHTHTHSLSLSLFSALLGPSSLSAPTFVFLVGLHNRYIAGAGPVGLAAAAGAKLLGAAVVIVGDLNQERLAQARSFGCETIDVAKDTPVPDQVLQQCIKHSQHFHRC